MSRWFNPSSTIRGESESLTKGEEVKSRARARRMILSPQRKLVGGRGVGHSFARKRFNDRDLAWAEGGCSVEKNRKG